MTESLGLLSTWEGEFTEAADQLRRAVDAYQSLDDRMSATISVQALGKVFLDLGDLDAARERLQKTAAAFTEMHYAWGEGVSRRLLASVYLAAGLPDRALPELDRAEQLLRGLQQPVSLARVFAVRASVPAELCRLPEAVEAADAALGILDEYGHDEAPRLRSLRQEWQTRIGTSDS